MTYHSPNEWSEADTEQLTKLWREGLSCSQIAARFEGRTRNAVIGRVHRLGISGRITPPTIERQRRTRIRLPLVKQARAPKPIPAPPAPISAPEPLHLTIMELTLTTCKFPLGEKPFTYCGVETEEHRSFCPHHHSIAYQTVTAQQARYLADRAARWR